MRHDAQTIAICEQMLFVHREREALVEHDEYAPQADSPNHDRHEALLAEWAALAAALTKAAPPTTPKGVRMLAKVAMTLTERNWDKKLSAPEDLADWVWLFALMSAARKPERIPLPEMLPDYWPA